MSSTFKTLSCPEIKADVLVEYGISKGGTPAKVEFAWMKECNKSSNCKYGRIGRADWDNGCIAYRSASSLIQVK